MDWADEAAERVARLLLVAEALGIRKASKMAAAYMETEEAQLHSNLAVASNVSTNLAIEMRNRAEKIERGEDA